ncbi:MAG: hypothetical protein K2J37_05540 [Ruminococcus sp.]|nr:hypothetical protein [Ruminococcus sp.]MDE6783891.1 hypothetical protein [Ruminococcus sp.]
MEFVRQHSLFVSFVISLFATMIVDKFFFNRIFSKEHIFFQDDETDKQTESEKTIISQEDNDLK